MGLDMWLFKIERLNDKEVAELAEKHIDEISQAGCNYIEKNAFEEYLDMYTDLEAFVRRVKVKREVFDYEACFKTHGISKDDTPFGSFQSPISIGWTFRSGAKVEINREEYESYLHTEDDEVYVFKSEDVAYWRKYYELDDFFRERRVVENCGYYLLEEEEKKDLKKFLKKHNPEEWKSHDSNYDIALLDDETANIFYYAWW